VVVRDLHERGHGVLNIDLGSLAGITAPGGEIPFLRADLTDFGRPSRR
jgi:hypothetical protein